MAATAKPTIEIELSRERDTKKMVRFNEEGEKGAPKDSEAVCNKFYISKTALERLGNPSTLFMRLEGGE